MTVSIKKVISDFEFSACLFIRKKVFIEEQHIAIELEIDGLDDQSIHYIIKDDDEPIGTARVRYSESIAKIERVAVLKAHRGRGYAYQLMTVIISDIIQSQRVNKILLGAQSTVIPFYEKLGFVVFGEEYIDAGIKHRDMCMIINQIKD